MACLMRYGFPGNVRELENAVEHAFVVCGGDVIRSEDLPRQIVEENGTAATSETSRFASGPLEHAEAAAIREALERHHGNRTHAAQDLGVSRNTLWRKMKRHGIR
jgi:transcriptional regulator of acetoin/glycerol metabolism